MDVYLGASTARNLPLLLILGLGTPSEDALSPNERGLRIASDVPSVETNDAQLLVKYFQGCNSNSMAWNKIEHEGQSRFRVKVAGRGYILPSRHANLSAPPSISVDSQGSGSGLRPVLHSPLSPLSPDSTVFPDGLIDLKWIEKHQENLPSAFVSFYSFTHDQKLSTLRDNQLKSDIIALKNVLAQARVRCRLIVVLLSEKTQGQACSVEERLANIRRATGLDPKTSLFLVPSQCSSAELKSFVETLLNTIYPLCIEYYRDLSKHTRRKKNRSAIPPPTIRPTSTSQTLSSQGWSVRYDFKLGIFAEFRQEIEAAIRSFESGYEMLLGPEVFETIVSWSPRWNEARLLSDVFAIHIIRCLLWNGNPTVAIRRWRQHRNRIRDFVDRRGKGSLTYGWAAWEARWAMVMAEILQKVSLSDFQPSQSAVYLGPESSIPIGEQVQPEECLHHPGYYFYIASRNLDKRRTLALGIPDDDKMVSMSTALSQVLSKSSSYDTYLCPEPYFEATKVDHSMLIIDALSKAMTEFEMRGQQRQLEMMQFLIAKEKMRQKAFHDASHILRSLWQTMTYRAEGWFTVVEEIGWALRDAAAAVGDGECVISVDWELLHRNFYQRRDWHYDLSKSLEGVDVKTKPLILLSNQRVQYFLSAAFSFEQSEAKVGEPCRSQLVIVSDALPVSTAIKIAGLRIDFEGSMRSIVLKHIASEKQRSEKIAFRRVSLIDGFQYTDKEQADAREFPPALIGEVGLDLSPSQSKVFEFETIHKEAGYAKAICVTFFVAYKDFELQYVHHLQTKYVSSIWWTNGRSKRILVRSSALSITILPKPPKLELRLVDQAANYYTNEDISLQLEVFNNEEDESIVKLTAEGTSTPSIQLTLSDATTDGHSFGQPRLTVGKMASASVTEVNLHMKATGVPATYDIDITAKYMLAAEMDIVLSVSKLIRLEVMDPFEANYEFVPRLHFGPWASLFLFDEPPNVSKAQGLAQRWCLVARYASFATDELIVEDIDVRIIDVTGGIHCSTKKLRPIPRSGLHLKPKDLEETQFDILCQQLTLDDRRISMLDCFLAIKWRRNVPNSPLHTMQLAVPRLLLSNCEPRVLASVLYSTTIPSMIYFNVTFENPSSHFLTFSLTMEPNEDFAVSGMKQSILQLVPLSRRTVKFRLLSCIIGDWIGPVNCMIRDRYFQKVLKVTPTEGMKLDKEGTFIWVPKFDDSQ